MRVINSIQPLKIASNVPLYLNSTIKLKRRNCFLHLFNDFGLLSHRFQNVLSFIASFLFALSFLLLIFGVSSNLFRCYVFRQLILVTKKLLIYFLPLSLVFTVKMRLV